MSDDETPAIAVVAELLGKTLDQTLNGPVGSPRTKFFVLLIGSFDDKGTLQPGLVETAYASNADRAAAIGLLREVIGHLEGRVASEPGHA